jgi:hypothetical protein
MSFQPTPSTEHFQPVMPMPMPVSMPMGPPAGSRDELPVAELNLRRLVTAREISRIHYLRDEIDLPASALRDPAFRSLEKKETRTASSARSSGAA